MKIHIAIVRTKHDEFALAATTAAGRTKKLADWCRQFPADQWFAEEDVTDTLIAQMTDEQVVDTYFAINPSDGYTEDEEEIALDLTIVMDGGCIQSVVSQDPGLVDTVLQVIDYDTDGEPGDNLDLVIQGDGAEQEAFVWEIQVEPSEIAVKGELA